jgi:hypothetical protein
MRIFVFFFSRPKKGTMFYVENEKCFVFFFSELLLFLQFCSVAKIIFLESIAK